jgi:hypothetical protein
MTLWDPQGKSWMVNYVYYNDCSVAPFSGRWGKLSVGNNLEKFDVCIFELFKEDNFKVHKLCTCVMMGTLLYRFHFLKLLFVEFVAVRMLHYMDSTLCSL